MGILSSKDIHWIDSVKCICMLSVYLIHSQFYYGYGNIKYGNVLVPFFINGFFFVSGYLFFYKQLSPSIDSKGTFSKAKQQINNTIFRLIIPTVLFSTIVFIPKNLFHSNNLNWGTYFFEVFGGISFWFTSALTIVQIIFIALLLSRKKNIWFYFIVSVVLSLTAIYFNNQHSIVSLSFYFPWYYKTALAYTFLYALGGIYMKYEMKIDQICKKCLPLLMLIYIVAFIFWGDLNVTLLSLRGQMNIAGLLIMLVSFVLIIALSKSFTPTLLIKYIGRKSIVLYFFSGVFPAFIGHIAKHFFPIPHYAITIVVAIISFALGLLTTWVINNYFPFLTDFRKIGNQSKRT